MGEDDDLAVFERLFKEPSIEVMRGFEPETFERFVGFVFTCAGYSVEHVARHKYPHGSGMDLDLYSGSLKGRPTARVEVRRYGEQNLIEANDVMAFAAKIRAAGDAPGYLVTTSGFTGPAIHFAANARTPIHLFDQRRWLRYIVYVGGSRLGGEFAGAPSSPPRPTDPECILSAEEIFQRTAHPPRKVHILTVANGKGGVAKTTTALNVAFALADHKQQRVLLVDMDGQASVTLSLPQPLPPKVPKETPAPPDTKFMSDYFRGQQTLASLVRATRFPGLSLIPANDELQRLDSGGYARPQAELRFVDDLRSLSLVDTLGSDPPPFDWIVIDTPPAQSFFTRAAVAAADFILIPAFAENFAVRGLKGVLGTIQTMDGLMGDANHWSAHHWKGRIIGCVICRWKPSNAANSALSSLQRDLDATGIRRLPKEIPQDDRVEDAHLKTIGGGIRSIFRLTNRPGPAATAYDTLTEEVVSHVNRHTTQAKRD